MEFNEQFIQELSQIEAPPDVLNQFQAIPECHKQVEFVSNVLAEVIENLGAKFVRHVEKSDDKCLEYRREGIELFTKQRNFYGALVRFNKSICFATPGSANMGIGYMNRSAVLVEMCRYRECKANIEMVRETAVPVQFQTKLAAREQLCDQLKDSQVEKNTEMDYQLTHPPHSKVDYISEFLQLTETDEKWGIQSRGKLTAGDLVSIEVAYCSSLQPHALYAYCAYCLKENYFSMIACPNCTNTMFCNEECMKLGYDTFHKYECAIGDILLQLFDKFAFGVRVFLVSMHLFETFDEFIEFCKDPANANQNVFTLNTENNDRRKEHLKAVLGLIKNHSKEASIDQFHFAVMTAITRKYMLEFTPIKDILDTEMKMNSFTDIMFNCLQIADYHISEVPTTQPRDVTDQYDNYASAIFTFGSLINHSMDFNVLRVFSGAKCFLFTLKNVPKYTEIFLNYAHPSITAFKGVPENYEQNYPNRVESSV